MDGSNLRLTQPLAIIDLESTGVDPANDRIVEIAVVKLHPDGSPQLFHERVKPPGPIPVSAIAIHGITNEDVANCGPFPALAERLATFLEGSDLAGFGVSTFDLPLLFPHP